MKPIEWKESEFGETFTWLEERNKAVKHQREQQEEAYHLNRINTFYMVAMWAKGIKNPKDLYELPGDEEVKNIDKSKYNPFTPEVEAAFEKMEKMKFEKGEGNFIKEAKIEWHQQ